VASADRQRFITMGALMLLTTALAFYCGASIAAMSLARPFLHAFGYGLFLAGSVFFIDRSIVGYVAPRRPGDDRSKEPRHSRWAIGLRMLIATAASVLLAEVLLLQIFTPRIDVQLASDNAVAQQTAVASLNTLYDSQIKPVQARVTTAQQEVNTLTSQYQSALHQVDCQEFGCTGIPAGQGPAFQAAERELHTVQAQLNNAQANLQTVRSTADAQINQLYAERQQSLATSQRVTSGSQDMLAREQAFWALTVKYPEIAVARVLLMLLLLSIDLAPIIVKITSSYGAYEENIRSEMLEERLRTEAYAEYMEAKIRLDAQVHLARQELDRDLALLALQQQREQREPHRPNPGQ
jgi:hypothetical protein